MNDTVNPQGNPQGKGLVMVLQQMAAAAPAEIPPELLGQLADGGRLVIPVGEHEQHLMLVVRQGDEFIHQQVEPVRFVPLLAGAIHS